MAQAPHSPALTLDQALAIASHARAAARGKGLPGISVVVLDADGAVRAALREDPQGTYSVTFATAKARTALGFLRSSLQVSQIFKDPATVTGLSGAIEGGILPLGGGVLVLDAQGRRLGAAAVAGGLPQTDHDIITAGVEAAGLLAG
jgi:uncharacterized protein GlcG (DUF336 family)